MRRMLSMTVLGAALAFASQSLAAETDWTKVDAILAKEVTVQGEVHRYGLPRTDLQVTVDGVAIKPALRDSRLAAQDEARSQVMATNKELNRCAFP